MVNQNVSTHDPDWPVFHPRLGVSCLLEGPGRSLLSRVVWFFTLVCFHILTHPV